MQATENLLNEEKTSIEKFESIRSLIKGINPKIDKALALCSQELSKLRKLQKGEVIDLIVENLPEETKEEKKRKKALLLFLVRWKNLKSEVKRVRREFEQAKQQGTAEGRITAFGKILAFAKGPLGIVTFIAAGIAVAAIVLQSMAVKVVVKNNGCEPISFPATPFPIPGLTLPKQAVVSGSSGVITVPPLTVRVDESTRGIMRISLLGITRSFEVGSTEIQLNGTSLSGRANSIRLGERKEHTVVVSCK